jgi:uncharacterized OsmC-like protein
VDEMSTITAVYRGDQGIEAIVGKHRLLVDAPPGLGGKGRGPTSSELFVASLGTCVAAFVGAYCDRAGLDTTDLTVDVTFDQQDDPTCLVDIEVVVNLPHADAGQREAAIRRVAEHCPVHETVEYSLDVVHFEVRDRSQLARAAGR